MRIRLEKAEANHLDMLASMNKQLIEDEGSANPMTLEQLRERMAEWLRSDWEADLLVGSGEGAEGSGDAVLGYALYRFRNGQYVSERKEVYLRQYFIRRESRREGVGRRGLDLLMRQRFRDAELVELDVLEGNRSGLRFWSGIGFETYARTMRLPLAPRDSIHLEEDKR